MVYLEMQYADHPRRMSNPMNGLPSTLRNALALAAFILATFCAPLVGMWSLPGAWYAALIKPSWNPPAWIFGPAWTVLYTLMAVAAWLVWKRNGWSFPLVLYFLQLGLNAAWTPIFFGAHALGWALIEIIALWIAILLTLLSFRRVSRPAAWLLTPYLAWVTFATALNFALWRLNPG
jgi:benzodiazapine receptor